MSKLIRMSVMAMAALTIAGSAEAASKRCRVHVGGDWKVIDRTFTDGGCGVEAKKAVMALRCADGDKKFTYKYMFDGRITEKEGFCK